MKALVKTAAGFDNMQVMEVEAPKASEEEVLLKIKAVGVCGSDLHMYKGGTKCKIPLILGHEFVGEIVELGEKVKGYSLGDIVVSESNKGACGVCKNCRSGKSHLCPEKRGFGYLSDGGMAEYLNVNYRLLHHAPKGVSVEECACIEPAAVITYAITERTKIDAEDIVLVSGVGPIGLIGIQIARLCGASKIIATGITSDSEARFDLAKKFGADATIDVLKENFEERLNEITGGEPVDVAIECSGAISAVNSAIKVVKRGGKICAVGLPPVTNDGIDYHTMILKCIALIGCFGSSSITWDKVISMVERKALDLKDIITDVVSLDDWRSAFEKAGAPEFVKAIVEP